MSVPVVAVFVVAIWLISKIFLFLRSPKTSEDKLTEPPTFTSRIPFIGHVLNIATQGSNVYLSQLCASQKAPIATMRLPGQDMHLIHPQDADSIKQFTGMQKLSLMTVFHVAVGPSMGLVPASDKFLTDPDTGVFKKELSKLFNGELRSLQNLKKHAVQLQDKVDQYWDKTINDPEGVRVGLGSWIFDWLSYSMGAVFWGEEGPFEDAQFREYLRIFIQNLEAMRNPITFLIPKELFTAREYVRKKLDRAAGDETYGSSNQEPTLFARLATLYASLDMPQAGYTDCHLVAIVGLMSNVINMMVWALTRIVLDSELHAAILTELNQVAEVGAKDNLSPNAAAMTHVDADRIRNECPLLVATWYELLRHYGDSPVARSVYEDSTFLSKFRIRKDSIIMTPIHLHNFDARIWGPDVEDFKPVRFIRADGKTIDTELVKHLNVFGLPGMHQCPGRYLALTMTLAVVAKVVLGFDVEVVEKGEGEKEGSVPKRKETMLGLPAMASEPLVVVKRREGVKGVSVRFEDVRPGW